MFIKTQEYLAWKAMRWKCRKQGLEVAPEMNTFAGFMAVMGKPPLHSVRLVRNDTAVGLIPGNVAWFRPRPCNEAYYGAQRSWEQMRHVCQLAGYPVAPSLDTFAKFLSLFGPRPSADHRLTRKNPKLGLTEENVMWARVGEAPLQKAKYGLSDDEHARITAIAKACKIQPVQLLKMLLLGLTSKEILFEQEQRLLDAAQQPTNQE